MGNNSESSQTDNRGGLEMPRKGQESRSITESLRELWKDPFYRKQHTKSRKKAVDKQMRERVAGIERALAKRYKEQEEKKRRQ